MVQFCRFRFVCVYVFIFIYTSVSNLWGLLKPNSIWVFVWFNHWVIISILHLIIVEMSRDVVKYTVWEPRKNHLIITVFLVWQISLTDSKMYDSVNCFCIGTHSQIDYWILCVFQIAMDGLRGTTPSSSSLCPICLDLISSRSLSLVLTRRFFVIFV